MFLSQVAHWRLVLLRALLALLVGHLGALGSDQLLYVLGVQLRCSLHLVLQRLQLSQHRVHLLELLSQLLVLNCSLLCSRVAQSKMSNSVIYYGTLSLLHHALLLEYAGHDTSLIILVNRLYVLPLILHRLQRFHPLLQDVGSQPPHEHLVVDGLLVELLPDVPLLPHFMLQSCMYLLEFLELGVLLVQIIVQDQALAGQVLLREHVVLHAKLHDFDRLAGIRRRLSALGLLFDVSEGDGVHVLADVVGEVGGVPQGLGGAEAILEARLRHTEFELFIRLVEVQQVLVLRAEQTNLVPINVRVLIPLEGKNLAIGVDVGVPVVDSDLAFLHFSL